MNKKKIFCFILPSFFKERKGGSELQSFYIAEELIKRGWDVHYIRENSNKDGKQEKINGITLHALPRRKSYLRWSNVINLRKIIRNIKADILYCRSSISYLAPLVVHAKSIGAKVVWACSHDTQLNGRLFKTKELSLYEKIIFGTYKSFDKFLFEKSLKRADFIILQTSNQRKLLMNHYRLDGHVIYNAHPIPDSINKNRGKLILWIARLHDWKHPEIFIGLAKKLKAHDYKFVMVGRQINEDTAKIVFNAHNNLSNFEYKGELEIDQINDLILRAKLLVSTSEYEGFPNTFVQAWLRGLPVVSLRVDPSNFINDYHLGKVSQNIEQLHSDIDHLMGDYLLWNEISDNCRLYASEFFDIRKHVDTLEAIIEKCTKR